MSIFCVTISLNGRGEFRGFGFGEVAISWLAVCKFESRFGIEGGSGLARGVEMARPIETHAVEGSVYCEFRAASERARQKPRPLAPSCYALPRRRHTAAALLLLLPVASSALARQIRPESIPLPLRAPPIPHTSTAHAHVMRSHLGRAAR